MIHAVVLATIAGLAGDSDEWATFAPAHAAHEIRVPPDFAPAAPAPNGWLRWTRAARDSEPWELLLSAGPGSLDAAWRGAWTGWGRAADDAPAPDVGQRVSTLDRSLARVWFDEVEVDAGQSYLGFAYLTRGEEVAPLAIAFRCPAKARARGEPTFQEIVRTAVLDRREAALLRLESEGRLSPRLAETVRRRLTGWEFTLSPGERFLVLHHSDGRSAAAAHALAEHLEPVADAVAKLLPVSEPSEDVRLIRFCESSREYFAWGGPGGSTGHYDRGTREATLYDASPARDLDADTLATASSLVVSQHVHAHAEALPHDWFVTGLREYVAGARFERGRFTIGPNPWQVTTARQVVLGGESIPLDAFLRQDRDPFQGRLFAHVAQAWAVQYALRELVDEPRRAAWNDAVGRYWVALRDGGTRDEALDALLDGPEGFDLADLDRAWATAIAEME